MWDVLLLVTMIGVSTGLGLPVASLLPERFAWRALVAPALGMAILAVLVPATYRLGVSVRVSLVVAIVLSLVSLGFHARRIRTQLRAMPRRTIAWIAGTVLAVAIVLVAPRYAGGDQFAQFQGNAWDQFAYLESGVTYAHRSHRAVINTTEKQIAKNPIFGIAQGQLFERPSVHLLYATFTSVAPGHAYRLHYSFLVFFVLEMFLVGAFVARSLLRDAHVAFPLAIAAAFPLGFWGQYILDINAWSHVAVAPLLLLLFGLLVHVAAGEHGLRTTAVLAVTVAGSLFFYPEGFLVYAGASFPIAGAFVLYRIVRRRASIRELLPFTSVAAIATSLLYMPVFHFMLRQISFAQKAKVPWWRFFQAFFAGRDGSWDNGFAQQSDFGAGIFGLYFATPAAGASLALVQRLTIVVVIAGLLAGVVLLIVRAAREDRVRYAAWTLGTLLSLVPAIFLLRGGNYWPAGKALSYVTPLLTMLLCFPVAVRELRFARIIPGAFIAFQLASGVARIPAAASEYGIHYGAPYPAVNPPGAKREMRWDLTALEPYLSPKTKVLLHPSHMWLEHGLMIFMYSRGIPFARPGWVNTYFGDGVNLEAPPPSWEPDIELTADGRTFLLHYPHGDHPDVRLQ